MKNLNKFALVAAMSFTFAACGNNANTAENTETVPAAGYGGDIKVTVNFGKDGVIESIDTKHTETEDIGAKAIPELTDAIIKANGTEGVDNVSGATVTSEAFKSAVNEAIANAK